MGDTMETDIIGGIYMGFKTILVLSGIADEKELVKYGYRPHLIVDSVEQIRFPLAWWQ
ncbi:HAD hydrolase-like protein [Mucilaginibacter flavus]|uniref:HAD hydrolase-like protein n=1 Tax=Mucilaginibacter flavus TaxID=931504 RepID=UPI0025B2B65C|nr:HAD hydrolase-like protein [Mucilaginibacter flavus]MDN3583466.1 HAD hydrolase-like protein [Mucilaginibacter flavus]